MTDDIVARARAALEGVTRPWRWSGGEGDDPALVFIDAAPGLMSELLAEVERLRDRVDFLEFEFETERDRASEHFDSRMTAEIAVENLRDQLDRTANILADEVNRLRGNQ